MYEALLVEKITVEGLRKKLPLAFGGSAGVGSYSPEEYLAAIDAMSKTELRERILQVKPFPDLSIAGMYY